MQEPWKVIAAGITITTMTGCDTFNGGNEGALQMNDDKYPNVVLEMAVKAFVREPYVQANLGMTVDSVCMRAAGWKAVDFDTLMAVSGASALFAYHHRNDLPSHAFLWIGSEERILKATGYDSEWVPFKDEDEAWKLIRQTIDSGRVVKAHCEGYYVLFMGYQDAVQKEDRKLFSGTNLGEPGWWDWRGFVGWAQSKDVSQGKICRHTEERPKLSDEDVALRVMNDLVAWSTEPPESVRSKAPQAKFGLAGIEQYTEDLADTEGKPEDYFGSPWRGCYAINPQLNARNSTGVYLERLAQKKVFSKEVNGHLFAASKEYKAVYAAWQEFYRQLGHDAPKNAWATKKHRLAGATAVRDGLEHEKVGIAEIQKALALIEK